MRISNIVLAASALCVATAFPSASLKKRVSKFKFFGVNESGGEFGSGAIPGQLNKDYVWPVTSSIDTLVADGINIFRGSSYSKSDIKSS